jgi:catechol 2,3-dioxygenase-like lactoylglutathione lyase family enzyme
VISGVRHTGIVVSDLQGGIRFWVDLLGFQIVSNQLESGDFVDRLLGLVDVQVQTVKLKSNDATMVELLHYKSSHSSPFWERSTYSRGITHIALNTQDVDELVQRLRKEGFHSINEPEISPDKRVKACYLRGFEGVLLELVETLDHENS